MPSYSITYPVPSCKVSRQLLEGLEAYMARKATELNRDGERVTLSIADSFGTEELQTIRDYLPTYLPEGAHHIRLKYDDYSTPRISITFDSLRFLSGIEVATEGDAAREIEWGISTEILRIIDAHRTVNAWFHPKSWWLLVPGFLTTGAALGAGPALITKVPSDWKVEVGLAFGGYLILVLGYVVASQLKPYMTFDTRSRAAVDRWSNWFVFSFASFILFGVIGTLTLKQLLN